jgi:hypothetical protein
MTKKTPIPFNIKFFGKYKKHYRNQTVKDKTYIPRDENSEFDQQFTDSKPHIPRVILHTPTLKEYVPEEVKDHVDFVEACKSFQENLENPVPAYEPSEREKLRAERKALIEQNKLDKQQWISELGINRSGWNRNLSNDFKYLKTSK